MTCTATFPGKRPTRCDRPRRHRGPHTHAFPTWSLTWWDEPADEAAPGYRRIGISLVGDGAPSLSDAYPALLRWAEEHTR